jgi:hypothetical protein
MKIIKLALITGLIQSLIASSCTILKVKRRVKNPWVRMGVTEDKYKAMQEWKSFIEVYYENIDYDNELEKIIIKSRPLERHPMGLITDYSNTVEIYIKRADVVIRHGLTGEERKLVGENTYHLKRVFMWRGAPVKNEDVEFEDKTLKVQDKEIIYNEKSDNFYFKNRKAINMSHMAGSTMGFKNPNEG